MFILKSLCHSKKFKNVCVDIFAIEANPGKAASKYDILMFCSGLLSGFSRSQLLENGIFRHFLAAKVVLYFNKRIKSTC